MSETNFSLDLYTIDELKELCSKLEIKPKRTKKELIADISSEFKIYVDYSNKKKNKYKIINQIGNKGKEGITYLVVDKKGNKYAMKTFKKTKSSKKLKKEFLLQKKAGKKGIAPKVYDYDVLEKFIVMELMDNHLYEELDKNPAFLTKKHQERIYEIYSTLDDIEVFHNDANICNYMLKNNKLYLIDYGFAKEINSKLIKEVKTDKPNSILMLIGFIITLKKKGVPASSYKYLLDKLPIQYKKEYDL